MGGGGETTSKEASLLKLANMYYFPYYSSFLNGCSCLACISPQKDGAITHSSWQVRGHWVQNWQMTGLNKHALGGGTERTLGQQDRHLPSTPVLTMEMAISSPYQLAAQVSEVKRVQWQHKQGMYWDDDKVGSHSRSQSRSRPNSTCYFRKA